MSSLCFDCQPIYSSLGGDPDLSDIVTLFVEEMPDRMAAMISMLDTGDWDGLRRLAHQLKGAAGSYGFDPLTPCAAAIEAGVRSNAAEQEIRLSVELLASMVQRMRSGSPAD